MSKYKIKPLVVEAVTFDELMEYGKTQTDNIYNNRPWSFEFANHAITHETDSIYIISSDTSDSCYFTPEKIIVMMNDDFCVLDKGQFDVMFEALEE